MNPAVHGTELVLVLVGFVVACIVTGVSAVFYVREAFKVGREVN